MVSPLVLLGLTLCLPYVLSRPDPEANLFHPNPSSLVRQDNFYLHSTAQQQQHGTVQQGGAQVPSNTQQLGIARPIWQTPIVKSNKVGGREETGTHYKSHPSILLNRLEPEKQLLFLEKFSLLNRYQQAFAFNMFFSVVPEVQIYAINQFIKLDAKQLVSSIQAEMNKVAKSNPDQVNLLLDDDGAQPELKLNSALVVKLPIGRVCRDQQLVDGWGRRTLFRDCETGVVYNINVNVELNIDGKRTNTTVNSTTTETTTKAPCEDVIDDSEVDCDPNWFTCPGGNECVPRCRL